MTPTTDNTHDGPDAPQTHEAPARLRDACLDARDCLTRATALYAQHWHEAAYPTSRTAEPKVSTSKPESRPPSGDMELVATLRATSRAVADAQSDLIAAGVAGETPLFALTVDAPPSVLVLHVAHVARALSAVAYGAEQVGRLDDRQIRRVFTACASGRAALSAWDTPVETRSLRRAEGDGETVTALRDSLAGHGTFLQPPAEFAKTAHIPRCPQCRFGLRERRSDGNGFRAVCEACRKARRKQPVCDECGERKPGLERERRDSVWVRICDDCRRARRTKSA